MNLSIICVTGDSFTNMYAATGSTSRDDVFSRVAREFVSEYVNDARDPDTVQTLLDNSRWVDAVTEYFDNHPKGEDYYFGFDTLTVG